MFGDEAKLSNFFCEGRKEGERGVRGVRLNGT